MSGAAVAGMDKIRLSGVSAIGHHGVFAHEKREGQPFFVDAVLYTSIAEAAADDDLAKTTDYGAVAEAITSLVTGEAFDLVETLTERIAARILADFDRITAVEVTVHKPKAPIQVPFGDVTVTIFRERS